jgi:hypothetical protein
MVVMVVVVVVVVVVGGLEVSWVVGVNVGFGGSWVDGEVGFGELCGGSSWIGRGDAFEGGASALWRGCGDFSS